MHPLLANAALTPRERQTLRHLLKGRNEAQTAKRMRLCASTVHVYVRGIYRKLRVKSRSQLMAKFLTHVEI